jgi:hypothetical protein
MRRGILKSLAFFSSVAMVSTAHATIEWSGFGSGRFAETLTDEVHNTSLDPHKAEYGKFSKLGLNVGSSISDKLDVAAQFVVGGSGATTGDIGSEQWNLNANWAFASYKIFDGLKFKYGRQLLPNFLAAEYAQVGYLQPYREIPQAISLMSFFKNFNGALIEYALATPVGTLTTSAWAGDVTITGSLGPLGTLTGKTSNLYGGGLTLTGDGYKARAQYSSSRSDVSMPTIAYTGGGIIEQTTLGASYDKNNIVVWAEYGQERSRDATAGPLSTNDFFEKASAYYILAGYHIGKFMPRFTYAKADFNKIGFIGLEGEEKDYTLGLNYQLDPSAILKVDYEMAKLADGKEGAFTRRDAKFPTTSDDKAEAIYAGIDFIF